MNKPELDAAVKTLEELPCQPRCRYLITCNPGHCDCSKKTLRDFLEKLEFEL